MSALTMTDLFCGAGGSSTGATSVPGVTVRLAANHWDKAIETHNTNHPTVDHLQADISNTDPRYVPRTDLLWASPECTNHSRAKGKKMPLQPDLFGETLTEDAVRRSRATMWDVVRFTEAHRYRAVIVENVVEVADWGDEDTARGGLFQAWLMAMHSMGYKHRIISLNSMHAQAGGLPAPQSRDRVYITFWRKGERAPDFERMQRPKAYCSGCDAVVDAMQWWKKGDGQSRPGRYRSQYLYRCPNAKCRNQAVEPGWLPASSIIDWRDGKQPGSMVYPMRTMTTRSETGIAYPPFMVERNFEYRTRGTDEAMSTVTANDTSKGLAFPPFIAELRGGGSTARAASESLSTVTASGNHHALIHRNNNSGGAEMTTSAHEPVRTITTAGHQSVLQADRPTVNLDDVRFRMLEPSEIKQAMAFPEAYVMVGTRREQVKLAGNAVTPPAARDLVAAVAEALTGEAS